MNKKTIAVIFGGQSVEHDISIITAHIPIIQSLTASGQFDIWPIYIAKNGSWYSDKTMNDLEFFKRNDFENYLSKKKKIRLLFDSGLKIIWPGFKQKTIAIDIVFPAMHGTFGEDGSLMGLLRMANVPFVGCDMFASAVAMDKALTKQILAAENIPIVPFVWFTKSDWGKNKNNLLQKIKKLKWPLFVKPVHLGSSIAISKVNPVRSSNRALNTVSANLYNIHSYNKTIKHFASNGVKQESELENAIEIAFHYDDKILAEESVENLIEITLPIIGNDELQLGGIERPLNKTGFFDFNDKYLSNNKKSGGVNNQYSEIPANISDALKQQVENLGKQTYRILGCSGIARIDFLIDKTSQKIYVNEVNTLPGSLYCHNWRKIGVSGVELVNKLVALAEERFNKQKNITYTFHSDILNQSGGKKITE